MGTRTSSDVNILMRSKLLPYIVPPGQGNTVCGVPRSAVWNLQMNLRPIKLPSPLRDPAMLVQVAPVRFIGGTELVPCNHFRNLRLPRMETLVRICSGTPVADAVLLITACTPAIPPESPLAVEGSEPEVVCATAIPPPRIRHSIL
jgi:hypothetical protein